MDKPKSFSDLFVWQKGYLLVMDIYKVTGKFPKEEMYGLTSQLRRAAISVTSNIAEGFVRHSPKDKRQFYLISLGSTAEIHSQLIFARDLHFITHEEFSRLLIMINEVGKLLNSLINSLKI